MNASEQKRDQFMRIANATLKRRYPFTPQRMAYAAKMYVKWLKKYEDSHTT